jgi:hypothetical protein
LCKKTTVPHTDFETCTQLTGVIGKAISLEIEIRPLPEVPKS